MKKKDDNGIMGLVTGGFQQVKCGDERHSKHIRMIMQQE
jgi:hypothetical protein